MEILHRSEEKKRPRCSECGKSMKRLISPAAFILKGAGWYVTDYPSQSRKEGMEAEKKAKKKSKSSKSEKAAPSSGKGKKRKSTGKD